MLAPEGPQRSVPAALVPVFAGGSTTECDFPEDLSRFRIDRGERAARPAAGIFGIRGQYVLTTEIGT